MCVYRCVPVSVPPPFLRHDLRTATTFETHNVHISGNISHIKNTSPVPGGPGQFFWVNNSEVRNMSRTTEKIDTSFNPHPTGGFGVLGVHIYWHGNLSSPCILFKICTLTCQALPSTQVTHLGIRCSHSWRKPAPFAICSVLALIQIEHLDPDYVN